MSDIYDYRGCVFGIIPSPDQPGISPADFMESALTDAREHSSSIPEMARYLVTQSFKHIKEPNIRYNAFVRAMTYMGLNIIDVYTRAARKAMRKASQGKDTQYWNGVADGILAAQAIARSPYSYRDALAKAIKEGRDERRKIERATRPAE